MSLYIAVYWPEITVIATHTEARELEPQEILRQLTPEVMQWSKGIWLLDMRPCLSYWSTEAQRQNQGLLATLQEAFSRMDSEQQVPALCAAHNPWCAVLLLRTMMERGLKGFVHRSQSPFGFSIFQQLTWDVWWESIDVFVNHLGTTKSTTKIHRHQQAMKTSVMRLKLGKPHDCYQLGVAGLRRRFGAVLADLVDWAFGEPNHHHSLEGLCLDGFPWHSYVFHQPISKTRYLEEPLHTWEQIEPLLMQDINRLCDAITPTMGELVTSLEWSITRYDLTTVHIPIAFRHPHHLRLDAPAHKTTLLQAYHSFVAHMSEHDRLYEDMEQPVPQVTAWSLTLCKIMPSTARMKPLFDDAHHDLDELHRLENLVAVPLERFDLVSDWLPEDSFSREQGASAAYWKGSLAVLGVSRPDFIFHKPQPLETQQQSSLRKFLERTMDKWWRRRNQQRDYYLMTTANGHQWVFQDSEGKWFHHGVFA